MTGFEGTSGLVRLVLRLDRLRLPVWVVALTALTYASGNAMRTTFPTQASIDAYAGSLAASPAATFLAGPPIALDTLPGIVMSKVAFIGIVGISLLGIFQVVRHTRTEEEEGRVELVRSAVVGRHAAGAAALAVAGVTALLAGFGVAVATAGASLPVADAALYGASVAALGIFFAALTFALAQLFTHARAVSGAALVLFGVFFVVRGAGDVQSSRLVWLSPIGWAQATHPLGADARWWPVLLLLAAAALLVAVAVVLAGHRDVGAGLVAGRPGRTEASRLLSGPVGLAFRTQRGVLVGWMLGMLALGAVYGSLTQAVRDMARDNPTLVKFFEAAGHGTLVDSFLATMLLVLALLTGGFAVSSGLRLTSEETSGRLEPLLATPLSRARWMLGSLLVTVVGTTAVLVAGGLGLGTSYAVAVGAPGQALRIAGLQLVYLPAVLVLAGLAALLHGWVRTGPRSSGGCSPRRPWPSPAPSRAAGPRGRRARAPPDRLTPRS